MNIVKDILLCEIYTTRKVKTGRNRHSSTNPAVWLVPYTWTQLGLLRMKKPSNKNGILVSFKLQVFLVKFGQTSEMVSSRGQIDHAQESVTSIFFQFWIKLFVKFVRWYSTGLKFLYQRTFNSWINKTFSQTTVTRPLSFERWSLHIEIRLY